MSKAASLLGVTVQTVYNYRKRWASVEAAWQALREERNDFVESSLQKLIAEGNATAIIFYLKTQARDRGYGEKVEHAGKIDGDRTIRFEWGDVDEPGNFDGHLLRRHGRRCARSATIWRKALRKNSSRRAT